jgi:BolA protein
LTTVKSDLSRSWRIESLLRARFASADVALTDESSLHAGHAGARPEGETHFRLRLVAADFAGQSRIERQRLIHTLLRHEFDNGLHALVMELRAPGEG